MHFDPKKTSASCGPGQEHTLLNALSSFILTRSSAGDVWPPLSAVAWFSLNTEKKHQKRSFFVFFYPRTPVLNLRPFSGDLRGPRLWFKGSMGFAL